MADQSRWRRAIGRSRAARWWRRARERSGRIAPPPVCDSVADWVSAHGGPEPRVLLAPHRYPLRAPESIVPLPQELRATEHQAPGRYLAVVDHARLLSSKGLVGLPDGSLSAESVYTAELARQQPQYLRRDRRRRVEMPGDHFSLLVLWSRGGNYYHWLHDTLTRVHGVLEHLPPDTRFVVADDLDDFRRASLRVVGVPEDRVVPYSDRDVWVLERLHFAPKTTWSGWSRPEVVEWLRDRFLAAYDIGPARTRRRLYVSRRAARRRRVENEADVERLLTGHGFETCVLEDLDHRAQVALFNEAEAVVAPHGAGLANLAFAPPGIPVVEIIEPGKLKQAHVFWSLADARGDEYWHVPAETRPRPGAQQRDMHVPIELLEATLERAGLEPTR